MDYPRIFIPSEIAARVGISIPPCNRIEAFSETGACGRTDPYSFIDPDYSLDSFIYDIKK